MSEREAVDLEPISEEMHDYVAAFAAVERPDPTTGNTTWAAIEAEIVPSKRRAIVIGMAAAVAIAAAVVLLVAGLTRAVLERDSDDSGVLAPHEGAPELSHEAVSAFDGRGVNAPRTARPEPAPELDEPAARHSVDGPDPVEPAGAASPSPRPARPGKERESLPQPKDEAPEQSASTLAEELRRFKAAKRALDLGDAASALAELQRYAEAFPRGVLRRESQVLRAEAMCAAGSRAKARALRDDFIESHALSPLASRMREVCRD